MSVVRRNILSALTALSVGALSACSDDPIGVEQLAAPQGVSATASSPSTVVVSWQPVAGATAYEVERAVGTSSDFDEVGTATSTSFTDAGLDLETQYRYRVMSVSGSQRSAPSAPASVQTSAAGQVTISSDITSNRTFHADTVYTLSGFIKVGNGATHTIHP